MQVERVYLSESERRRRKKEGRRKEKERGRQWNLDRTGLSPLRSNDTRYPRRYVIRSSRLFRQRAATCFAEKIRILCDQSGRRL